MDELGDDENTVADLVVGFRTHMRTSFHAAWQRSGRYRQLIVDILEREGVPGELSYLPLIESSYRTDAVSDAGAVGPWQFMRATGHRYGLRIDAYVDERRDPEHSTRAAARYLRELRERFGSWQLALAAYNIGPGRVARALSQNGAGTYGDLLARGSLPRHVRHYVARFMATLQITRAPERYGFAHPVAVPAKFDVVLAPRSVSFGELAPMVGASAAELAELNPALIRAMTPPDRHGYPVRIPRGLQSGFGIASHSTATSAPGSECSAPDRTD